MEIYDVHVAEEGMGELLLCNETIAAMPYYVENISVNLYSLEELCYYITHNAYLLERDFMCEELCTWLEKELKLVQLADRLRDILREQGRLSDFVRMILTENGYCLPREIQEVCEVILAMEEKSDFECSKIRADRLMEREKYLSCIYEYKRLLDSEDAKNENALIVGNLWHNLGTAYARLFLFEEAADCYRKAYKLNQNHASLKAELFAYRCMHDESSFTRTAMENNLDDTAMQAIRNELTLLSRGEETARFEEKLEQIVQMKEQGNQTRYRLALQEIIINWKEDYRHHVI
jgi:tetratricopeptide (TPR) repeat protein